MSYNIVFIPYIIDVVSNLSSLAGATIAIAVIASVSSAIICFACEDFSLLKKVAAYIKPMYVTLLLAIAVVIPSKSTMYQMVALYGGITIANTSEIRSIAPKTLKVLEKMADDYLAENKEDLLKKGEK